MYNEQAMNQKLISKSVIGSLKLTTNEYKTSYFQFTSKIIKLLSKYIMFQNLIKDNSKINWKQIKNNYILVTDSITAGEISV